MSSGGRRAVNVEERCAPRADFMTGQRRAPSLAFGPAVSDIIIFTYPKR